MWKLGCQDRPAVALAANDALQACGFFLQSPFNALSEWHKGV